MVLGWVKYVSRLLGSAFLLIFAVVVVMFLLLDLAPGDPVQSLVGFVPVSEAFRQQMTELYGLDRPLPERFATYVWNIAQGNLGYSYANQSPVTELIGDRIWNTLALTVPSTIIAAIGGIVLGAYAARTRSRMKDGTISFLSVAGFSIPNFWLGLLLILLFSVHLGWLPAQGTGPFGTSGISWNHLILPLAALTVAELAYTTRIMRSSMIEVLGQDYIDAARAKGLSTFEILRRHGLRNAMIPMIAVIGYSLGFTLAGTVVVEKVFGWPGMGLLLFDSIHAGENMVVMGILLVITVTIVIVNLLTDLVYGMVDPRIRARLRSVKGVG
ncbi:ABC transporter permease [Nesterenkonia suensis]